MPAPGSQRLKPEHENLLSSFAFNSNLRHYIVGHATLRGGGRVVLRRQSGAGSAANQSARNVHRGSVRQGLTLVQFSSQPEPIWSRKPPKPPMVSLKKVLTLMRKADECKPLVSGSASAATVFAGFALTAALAPAVWRCRLNLHTHIESAWN
jgi:hypothetical protein